jgi:DHA1 family inner membrane transport protein
MPFAIYALTIGAFGIGVTEFVLMGLLVQVGQSLGVSISTAGLLISGYAIGVAFGAPVLTIALSGWSRKNVLLALMVVFTVGNAACALAPNYWFLLSARVITALSHGTFFGVGSVVATSLVKNDRKASALAIMFTGLTAANVLGVPFGTWLGLQFGWRATFWAVTAIGVVSLLVMVEFVPQDINIRTNGDWRTDVRAMMTTPVLNALLVTALGFAGLFTVFTYIAPVLTDVTGFKEDAVSPILLVFGGGLVIGNLLGGTLADRWLAATVAGSLAVLAVVLAGFGVFLSSKVATVVMVGLLGAASFATVAPLQMFVMRNVRGVGESLASSLNISAFNVGNAFGAWLGGFVVTRGYGFADLPYIAAIIPVIALVVFRGLRDTSAEGPA